ncbi:hypothetical protein BDY19DRAFT_906909 [Irpex rosettiformis]|uniref:Uncharacterized protein n=1 Tax=Irpex rosettiformis TaxID=378272 RepID=A0ACB8U2G4_9APHY|nr:hypothetical protein BDY19DRAFT_906909 [Irpex rosettiformis]
MGPYPYPLSTKPPHTMAYPVSSSHSTWPLNIAACCAPLIRTVPLPLVEVHVESILASTRYASKKILPIYFDLRYHTDLIRRGPVGAGTPSHHSLPSDILRKSASVPKTDALLIMVEYLDQVWEFHLETRGRYPYYLTIEEVFDSLYNFLREPIDDVERQRIRRSHPLIERRCQTAFKDRCAASHCRRQEESEGIRRVDLLPGPLFAGLERKSDGYLWMKTLPI